MKDVYRKIKYMIANRYNPYPIYWYDLLTERHVKNRTGECVDCIECCQFACSSLPCYCENVNIIERRCKVYNNRSCNVWFPVSQKEIDCRASVQKGFKCRFGYGK